MSEAISSMERMGFRAERANLIDADKTLDALPLDSNPRIVLHMIPSELLENSDLEKPFDLLGLPPELKSIHPKLREFMPIADSDALVGGKLNDEGLITYAGYNFEMISDRSGIGFQAREQITAYSYLQVFKNGIIEAVRASYNKKVKSIIHKRYEKDLLLAIPRYLSIQQQLGVKLPVNIILTLTGVEGCYMSEDGSTPTGGRIKTSQLRLPEIPINSFTTGSRAQLAEVMRPAFYEVWQAAGWPRSMNYNENDKWAGY